LKKHNISARKYFYPAINELDCYNETSSETPIASDISKRILTLPLYDSLEEKKVKKICKILKEKK